MKTLLLVIALLLLAIALLLGALLQRRGSGARGPARPLGPGHPGLAEIDELLRRNRKIAAIKRYRELTGAGLVEAKETVERRMR